MFARLSVNPALVARVLGATAALLLGASIAGQIATYNTEDSRIGAVARLFYIDGEKNLPTGFSVLVILLAAQLMMVLGALARVERSRWAGHWVVLGLGMFCMAVDEALILHERLIPQVRVLLGQERLGALYFAWVIPASGLVLVLGVLFLRFLMNLAARTRARLLLAGAIYLGGAIGMELVGGHYAEVHGTGNLRYAMLATVEEGLEMAGMIVCVWALLRHLEEHYAELRVRFASGGATDTV